jgi:hypothetical protein
MAGFNPAIRALIDSQLIKNRSKNPAYPRAGSAACRCRPAA